MYILDGSLANFYHKNGNEENVWTITLLKDVVKVAKVCFTRCMYFENNIDNNII